MKSVIRSNQNKKNQHVKSIHSMLYFARFKFRTNGLNNSIYLKNQNSLCTYKYLNIPRY